MNKHKSEYPKIWIGQNYESGGLFGKKILIVGESTHKRGDKNNPYKFENSNIDMALDHIGKYDEDGIYKNYSDQFRTKLMRVFLKSQGIYNDLIKEFWHSVAFFNYYIEPLHDAGEKPEKDTKHQPLAYRLSELKPHLVVAVSYRLWGEWIKDPPENLSFKEAANLDNAPKHLKYISLSSGFGVLGFGLIHPRRFSYRREIPILREVISKA